MSRILFPCICSTMLLGATSTFAQAKVEGGGYNLMLKTLLSHSVPEITVDSLAKIYDNVQLLDSREPEEFNVSHLEGAVAVGYDAYDPASVASLDKDRPVVVYCSVGYRSEKISEKLIEAGFTEVYNLYGGIFEWKNLGNSVVDSTGSTDRVHAFNRAWGVWLHEGEKVYE